MHFLTVEEECSRLRRLDAFSLTHEARVVPKPGVPTPRESHLLEWRAFDASKREWSDWQPISVEDSRARWPSPPPVEEQPRRPLNLAERLARVESILRSHGWLRE
jgi:hypothetical protein